MTNFSSLWPRNSVTLWWRFWYRKIALGSSFSFSRKRKERKRKNGEERQLKQGGRKESNEREEKERKKKNTYSPPLVSFFTSGWWNPWRQSEWFLSHHFLVSWFNWMILIQKLFLFDSGLKVRERRRKERKNKEKRKKKKERMTRWERKKFRNENIFPPKKWEFFDWLIKGRIKLQTKWMNKHPKKRKKMKE